VNGHNYPQVHSPESPIQLCSKQYGQLLILISTARGTTNSRALSHFETKITTFHFLGVTTRVLIAVPNEHD